MPCTKTKSKNKVIKFKLAPKRNKPGIKQNFDKHSQFIKTNTFNFTEELQPKIQVQKKTSVVLARTEQQRHNKKI